MKKKWILFLVAVIIILQIQINRSYEKERELLEANGNFVLYQRENHIKSRVSEIAKKLDVNVSDYYDMNDVPEELLSSETDPEE